MQLLLRNRTLMSARCIWDCKGTTKMGPVSILIPSATHLLSEPRRNIINAALYIEELLLACGYCSAIHSHYVSKLCNLSPTIPVCQNCARWCQYIFGIVYEGISAHSMNQKLPTEYARRFKHTDCTIPYSFNHKSTPSFNFMLQFILWTITSSWAAGLSDILHLLTQHIIYFSLRESVGIVTLQM